MNTSIRLKLFFMMILEFFIWGAWFPMIFGYLPGLGFDSTQTSWILSAFPIAAIVGMFFSNQFADRNFAAEKFLGFSHFIGGLAMVGLVFTKSFWPFCILMYVHCLFYVPTMSIVNSIAFANMKDAKNEFGLVRVGGTIGWILAAWPFTFILVDWEKVHAAKPSGVVEWLGTVLGSGLTGQPLLNATIYTFIVAGIASLLLAAFSLFLPHTPPKKASSSGNKLAWLEAIRLLKHPFLLVLWLVTIVDAFALNAYFNWTGMFLGAPAPAGVGIKGNWIMPVMSLGQIAEILTMLVLGGALKRLGWRWTMVIGILGHTARFGVYAFYPNQTAVIVVQLLHGICYAFFFATVYIFVDEYFPSDVRSSAQGLFNAVILGLGSLLANWICPWLLPKYTTDGITDFKGLFIVPMAAATLAAVVLALFFHPPPKQQFAHKT